MASPFIVLCPS